MEAGYLDNAIIVPFANLERLNGIVNRIQYRIKLFEPYLKQRVCTVSVAEMREALHEMLLVINLHIELECPMVFDFNELIAIRKILDNMQTANNEEANRLDAEEGEY
jgi:hypothetical protein